MRFLPAVEMTVFIDETSDIQLTKNAEGAMRNPKSSFLFKLKNN